jgi:hypothetical protein
MLDIYRLAIAVSDSDKKATAAVANLAEAIASAQNPEESAIAAVTAYGGKLTKTGALVCAADSPALRQARSRLAKRLNAAWGGAAVLVYRAAQGGAGQWVLLSGEQAQAAQAAKKQAQAAQAAKKEAEAVATSSQAVAASSTSNATILLQLAALFDRAASLGIPQKKIQSLLASKYPQTTKTAQKSAAQ